MEFQVQFELQGTVKGLVYSCLEGKYTIGLGQENMGIVSDREDVNSIALTALDKLIKSYSIDLSKIGRLEVGTETMVDKSKSVKRYFSVYGCSKSIFTVSVI